MVTRQTDIAIIGGGLAGSATAAMLGRADIDALLVDPHPVYPPDFRCEKLDRDQVRVLTTTGLEDAVRRASSTSGDVWIARRGPAHVERKTLGQYYFHYDTLVNAIRGAIPPAVPLVESKAAAIATGEQRQQVTLANGDEIWRG
ncbi:MAG: FAD-dependent monooxygenase [Bauldia sp.]